MRGIYYRAKKGEWKLFIGRAREGGGGGGVGDGEGSGRGFDGRKRTGEGEDLRNYEGGRRGGRKREKK